MELEGGHRKVRPTSKSPTFTVTNVWAIIILTVTFIVIEGAVVDAVTEEVRVKTATSLVTAVETWAGKVADALILSMGAVHYPVVQQIGGDAESPRTLKVGRRTAV